MKVLVTMKSILDTDDIGNKGVKLAIERFVYSKHPSNLAGYWALDEIDRYGNKKEITLRITIKYSK